RDGEVALLHHGGAEVHARRRVDEHPRREVRFGDARADVGLTGPGRDVPVHAPHVVLRGLVGPDVVELGAGPGPPPEPVAVQQTGGAAADGELLAPQRALGGREVQARGIRAGHAASSWVGVTRGAGTAPRTRATSARGGTPSTSAS